MGRRKLGYCRTANRLELKLRPTDSAIRAGDFEKERSPPRQNAPTILRSFAKATIDEATRTSSLLVNMPAAGVPSWILGSSSFYLPLRCLEGPSPLLKTVSGTVSKRKRLPRPGAHDEGARGGDPPPGNSATTKLRKQSGPQHHKKSPSPSNPPREAERELVEESPAGTSPMRPFPRSSQSFPVKDHGCRLPSPPKRTTYSGCERFKRPPVPPLSLWCARIGYETDTSLPPLPFGSAHSHRSKWEVAQKTTRGASQRAFHLPSALPDGIRWRSETQRGLESGRSIVTLLPDENALTNEANFQLCMFLERQASLDQIRALGQTKGKGPSADNAPKANVKPARNRTAASQLLSKSVPANPEKSTPALSQQPIKDLAIQRGPTKKFSPRGTPRELSARNDSLRGEYLQRMALLEAEEAAGRSAAAEIAENDSQISNLVEDLKAIMGTERYNSWNDSRGVASKAKPSLPTAMERVVGSALKDYFEINRPAFQPRDYHGPDGE
ncbi:hypothetical protein DFH09DRAFT_1426769 [Mycena vulgaris]|nr:hypothetical protein DFH09DRAFT_1426769 [Mycena vulgaris]